MAKNIFDDDYDLRPGGRGYSAEFARRYDPQGEQEYSNLPLNHQQIEEAHLNEDIDRHLQDMQELRSSAEGRVQFWPNVGKFIIPRENTFAAHLQLVRDPHAGLAFDPDSYKLFDKVIVETANRPDLFDPNHPDFDRHLPLRDNLAVLRNDLMGIYMDDGSFDPGDEKFIPYLTSIATELGQSIGNEKRMVPSLFSPKLNTRLLNMEADGAAYAYRHLKKQERGSGGLNDVINTIRGWMGMPVREWNLPPVEYTPFSEDGLNALPAVDVLCLSDAQLRSYVKSTQQQHAIAVDVEKTGQARQEAAPVEETLGFVQKREATDHGVTILKWFKDIKFSDKSVMELMDTGTPEEKVEMVGIVAKFVQYYQEIQAKAIKRNPNLANSAEIQAANEAAKVLEHSIELLAKLEKPVSMAQTAQISTDVTQQPDKWNELGHQTVDRLMQTLKGGLETAVSAFDQQQQDVERNEEVAAEAVLAAQNAQSSYQGKGKRKKKVVSGKGGKQQQSIAAALRADDRAAGQGIHANQGSVREQRQQVQESFRQSLQVQDISTMRDADLVRSIGKALANSSKSGSSKNNDGKAKDGGGGNGLSGLSGFSMADVSPDDKLKPDDQDIAKTIIDQRKRDQSQGPKGLK